MKFKGKKNIKERDSILTSCINIMFPVMLVLGGYMIVYQTLDNNSGFQGVVCIACAITIAYIYYGKHKIKDVFNLKNTRMLESSKLVIPIISATLILIYGYAFFRNIIFNQSSLSRIDSLGITFWMNFASSYKVLAGIVLLIIITANNLNKDDK